MPDRISHVIEIFQWIGIITIGLFTSIVPQYADGIAQILWTTLSMAVATVASFFIKKLLNRKRNKKNDTNNKA